MRYIGWMLTRMIVMRFLLILFGLSIFIITLEVVTYIDDILALRNHELSALLEYALLLAPSKISTFMGMSMLLAMLLTLSELSYRGELVPIWATGTSPVRLMVMLLPLAAVLGVLNFLVNDKAIPATAPVLNEWGIGDYGSAKLKVGEKDPIWLRSDNDILRAEGSNPQSTVLKGVTIFRRDTKGHLTEMILAKTARLINNRWELTDVIVYYRANLPASRLAKLIYSGAMRPAAAGARSGAPEEMSLSGLDYFIRNAGFGIRPAHVYETWWHQRLTLFLSAWLMIVICVPLAAKFRRGGGIGIMFAIGVLLGFVFFVFDGISVTLGELGVLPPWIAAWLPVLLFFGAGAWLTLRAETV